MPEERSMKTQRKSPVSKLFDILSLLVILSMLLAACAPGDSLAGSAGVDEEPTEEPAPPTEEPTEEPAPPPEE
ncbi:MAG: hypothetical protein KG029_08520, partial [Bacteroidetes bacterium]|nr:hypothetical protein [Bacteroidota bacterium]